MARGRSRRRARSGTEAAWTAHEAGRCAAHIDDTLAAYQELIVLAATNEQKLWREYPQNHYIAHIRYQCRWGNPRDWWCYVDEDFMGILKRTV